MYQVLNSLFPVFAVILFGYAAKHYKFLSGEFWPSCEKLAYYVLLPLILFINISTAEYHDISSYLNMVTVSISTISIIILLTFLAKYAFRIKDADFTSLLQGSVYANAAYIGIPSSYALFGQEGLVAYSLLMAAVVPFVNAITVVILGIYAHEDGNLLKAVAKKIVFHPIILACVIGFLFNYYGITLPKPIFGTLEILSKAAVAIGLIIVGGALDIKAIRGSWGYINAATFIKLIITPIIAIALAKYFGVTGLKANILVLYASLPTAAATYLLAKKMKGNAPLMAGIIVFETAMAFITMALMLHFAGEFISS
jgi:malonate transporter